MSSCILASDFRVTRLDPSSSQAAFAEFQSSSLEDTLKQEP